ncbi:MAG: argininosuccinate lyase, partial [Thermoanaerobaculia bacterium]
LTGLIAGLKLHRDRMRTTASNDLLLATELADALAARGVAFREAHEIVGRRLAESLRTGRSLRDLGPNAQITDDDLAALDVDRALAKRTAFGGTAPDRVRDAAKHVLGMARS